MKPHLPIMLAIILFISSCKDNDDQVKTVDKNGGIEVLLSTKHIDSLRDQLTTHYKVWRRGIMVKEFDKKDTVQSLGYFYAGDEKADEQDKKVNADYEYYVTVK